MLVADAAMMGEFDSRDLRRHRDAPGAVGKNVDIPARKETIQLPTLSTIDRSEVPDSIRQRVKFSVSRWLMYRGGGIVGMCR